MTNRDHTVLACILAIIGLYMVHLSSVEIQPWDEGLYALRGESIVKYGTWWDQTPHTLGGLYSSTAPPLTSWGTAVGISIFGRTVLGVRFFTLLCSALALWMMYLIGKRFLSYQGAILSICVLGTALPWVIYSRQAMTEVPLMAFVLVALWAADRVKGWKGERVEGDSQLATRYSLFFSVAFGAALLTKMAVSLLPVLFVLPLLRDKATRWRAVVMVIGGLAIAAPWYLTMLGRYGDDFWLAMTVPHVLTAVEGNSAGLGPLYYVNQLILAHPVIIVALIYVVAAVFRRSLLPTQDEQTPVLILLWFLVSMIIFSLSATKNPHYVVMILPAAVLAAVYGLERIVTQGPRRLTLLALTMMFVSASYAMMPGLRAALKQPALLLDDTTMLIVLSINGLLIISALFLPLTIVDEWTIRSYRGVVIFVSVGALIRAVTVVWNGYPEQIRGGREIAVSLLEQASAIKQFTYLYHQRNAGDAMNPQLAWYTAGWMNGWDPKYRYTPAHMPEKSADLNVIASVAVSGASWVVYYHPGVDTLTQTEVTAGLAALYDVAVSNPHYTLYQLR